VNLRDERKANHESIPFKKGKEFLAQKRKENLSIITGPNSNQLRRGAS